MPQLSKRNFAKSAAKVRSSKKGLCSSISPALTKDNIEKVLGVSKKPDSSYAAASRNTSISSKSKNKAIRKVVSIQLSYEEPNSENHYSDISYRMNEPAIKDAYRKFVMNLSQSTVNETICSTPLLERRSESVDIFSSSQSAIDVAATEVQSQDGKDKASMDSGLPPSQVSSKRNEMRESFDDLMNDKVKDHHEFNFMKNFKEPAKRKAGKSSLHKLKGMEEKPNKTKQNKQIIEPTEESVLKKKRGSRTMTEEPRTKNDKVIKQKNKNAALKAFDEAEEISLYDKMLLIQESRNVGLYCLCDNCDKARYLPDIKDPLDLPEKWYCSMNSDPNHNSCDDPEEALVDEDFLIDNLYNAGSIVWAKIDGYPWWPAMVEDDPDTEDYFYLEKKHDVKPAYYHVTFFDSYEVTRAWIRPKFAKPFKINMTNPEFQTPKFNKFRSRVECAFKQAEDAVNLSLIDRLRKYSFIQRYAKPLKHNKAKEEKPKKRSLKLKKQKSDKIKIPAKKKRTGCGKSDDDNLNKNQDLERIFAAKKKPLRKIISSDSDENSNISVILKDMDWDNENINLNIIEKFV